MDNNAKLFLVEIKKDKRYTQMFIAAANEETAREMASKSLGRRDELISISEQVVASIPEL